MLSSTFYIKTADFVQTVNKDKITVSYTGLYKKFSIKIPENMS